MTERPNRANTYSSSSITDEKDERKLAEIIRENDGFSLIEFIQSELNVKFDEEFDIMDSPTSYKDEMKRKCRAIISEAINASVAQGNQYAFSILENYIVSQTLKKLQDESDSVTKKDILELKTEPTGSTNDTEMLNYHLINYVKEKEKEILGKKPSPQQIDKLVTVAENEKLLDMWKLLEDGISISKEYILTDTQTDEMLMDPIRFSHIHLRNCSVYASASHTILTSKTPIVTALKLCSHFRGYSYHYPELQNEYRELASNCSNLAVDLLNCCSSIVEVEMILKEQMLDDSPLGTGMAFRRYRYPLLQFVVRKEMKDFIAHPHFQLTLGRIWMHRRSKDSIKYIKSHKVFEPRKWYLWLLYILGQIIFMPVMCIIYLIVSLKNKDNIKEIKIIQQTNVPLNRFIYFAVSYIFFLICLYFTSTDKSEHRTLFITRWYDWIILFWTIGLFYGLLYNWIQSIRHKTLPFFWTIYETFMLLLLMAGAVCVLIARGIDYLQKNYLTSSSFFQVSDVVLLGECFYALGLSLAYMRILQWFHLSYTIGYIIVSLSNMTSAILKLSIIFAVVAISFIQGIYLLYKDFIIENGGNSEDATFTNYGSTIQAFFWALFGQGDWKYAQIPENAKRAISRNDSLSESDSYNIISFVGEGLWGLFHIAMVIVLLNMLIAIMTNCFEYTSQNCDVEWKFARTHLLMFYIEKRTPIPPPLNIIFKTIVKVVKFIKYYCKDKEKRKQRKERMKREAWNKQLELNRLLVKRLLYHRAFSSSDTTSSTNNDLYKDTKKLIDLECIRPRSSFTHKFMKKWE